MMVTYKSVILRYCPSKEHNIQIEIAHHDDGQITERCLFSECGQKQCRVCGKKKAFGKRKKQE